ncbi:MAG: four helix bundle protein [Gemmatimonadaceae bacterium]
MIQNIRAIGWLVARGSFTPSCGMGDFKKLLVRQKAHAMALDAHRVASRIRGADHSSLRSQIIRSAMSVPANIVEGVGGGGWGASEQTAREFSRFPRIALNSTTELEYHLIAARDLQVVRGSDSLTLISQVVEVREMLYGLRRYLASQSKDGKQA